MAGFHKPLHKHAFWLYGVLVGLAIKGALEGTIPHIIQFDNIKELLNTKELTHPRSQYGAFPDLARLIVVLILVVRFYLGAAFFFGDVHEAEEPDNSFKDANYALDFMSGFAHFLSFVILGLTIDVHTKPVSWFPIIIAFILLYDMIWWAFSLPYATKKIIKWWALANVITLGASLIVYGFLLYPLKADRLSAEMWAYVPILLVSVYDLGGMMSGRPYFQGLRDALSD